MKYRCTFYNRSTDKSLKYDVIADSMDMASKMGYEYAESNSLYYKGYTDMTVSEIPEGISTIGVMFKSHDTVLKKDFVNRVFIDAESEKDAVRIYNETYLGKRFWFNSHEICEDGKNVYGEVVDTYYTA